MKITCDIVKDLLPLYYDQVCSEDSKKVVEEHLEHCDKCKEELKYMGGEYAYAVEIEEEKIAKFSSLAVKKFKITHLIIGALITTIIVLSISFTKYKYESQVGTTLSKRQERLQEANHETVKIIDEYLVDNEGRYIISTFEMYGGEQVGIAFFEKQENGSYHFKASSWAPDETVLTDIISDDYIVFYLDYPNLSYAELTITPDSGDAWTETHQTEGLFWIERPDLYSSFSIDVTYYDTGGNQVN